MSKVTVSTNKAPRAIGPYSQAVKAKHFLFVSGQLPMDPNSGSLVEGSIQDKTSRTIENIKAILEEAGTSLESVVKTTIYLTDISQFSAVNEIYSMYFSNLFPARSTIQIAGLPMGSPIEIEVIALIE
ncbi:MAG: RidA family protein [Desulfobacterales bacterium]|nr:MAG: RidA family protein [Desulfobacterales bacterium]